MGVKSSFMRSRSEGKWSMKIDGGGGRSGGGGAAAVVEGANPGLQSCPWIGLDWIGKWWAWRVIRHRDPARAARII